MLRQFDSGKNYGYRYALVMIFSCYFFSSRPGLLEKMTKGKFSQQTITDYFGLYYKLKAASPALNTVNAANVT